MQRPSLPEVCIRIVLEVFIRGSSMNKAVDHQCLPNFLVIRDIIAVFFETDNSPIKLNGMPMLPETYLVP